MAIKIYLSPAAHTNDPPCAVAGCSENTHVNLYLDALTPFLDAAGIAWRRNSADQRGYRGVTHAVEESNDWGATLHYVVHTGNGIALPCGSRLIAHPTGEGGEWAHTVAARRQAVYPNAVHVAYCDELYEIAKTHAPCVYDELVVHTDATDARWLHEHLHTLAKATAMAFCDIFSLRFRDPYAALA